MKKHTYINLATGEIVYYYTILGARRYFKNDAKRFKCSYARGLIMRLDKASKKGLV